MQSYITISDDPYFWGQDVTEKQAGRNAAKMEQVAKLAGMEHAGTKTERQGDEVYHEETYVIGDDSDGAEPVEWFNWYCSESKPWRSVKTLAKMFKKDVLGNG